MIFLWFSMLLSPTLISVGMIGPASGLSMSDSIVITVLASATGAVIPSFTATLCPAAGLRQIAFSRFSFGIWGAKVCGAFNVVINVGFAIVNCIIAGQLIAVVSNNSVPTAVGIVIISVLAFVVSLFGYAVIHRLDSVAWIWVFILLCVEWGQSSKYFAPIPAASTLVGIDRVGTGLTFFAGVFGTCAAWCSMAGDFYVHYPATVNRWLVFGLTWIGLALPSIFVGLLGVYYGAIIMTNDEMASIYSDGGIGALIIATMQPVGWAKFAGVCYALSFRELLLQPWRHFSSCFFEALTANCFPSIQPCGSSLLEFFVNSDLGKILDGGTAIHLEQYLGGNHPGRRLGRTQCSRGHP
jgi:purine-cytosine permease-like protein